MNQVLYNTDKVSIVNKFNLIHLYINAGAIPRIAKSMSTRLSRKLDIEMISGMVDISYIDLLIAEFGKREDSSKYKIPMLELLKKVKEGDKVNLPKDIFIPVKNFSTIDPFVSMFCLEKLLDKLAEKEDYEMLSYFEKIILDLKNSI